MVGVRCDKTNLQLLRQMPSTEITPSTAGSLLDAAREEITLFAVIQASDKESALFGRKRGEG